METERFEVTLKVLRRPHGQTDACLACCSCPLCTGPVPVRTASPSLAADQARPGGRGVCQPRPSPAPSTRPRGHLRPPSRLRLVCSPRCQVLSGSPDRRRKAPCGRLSAAWPQTSGLVFQCPSLGRKRDPPSVSPVSEADTRGGPQLVRTLVPFLRLFPQILARLGAGDNENLSRTVRCSSLALRRLRAASPVPGSSPLLELPPSLLCNLTLEAARPPLSA